MFPPRREKFISKRINQKGSSTIGYLSGSKEESPAGHRAVRPSVTGIKIGPLTLCRRRADCRAIVVKLVRHDIIENNSSNSVNLVLSIEISEPNQQALDLARRNGMKKISETACMYNKAIPSLPAAGQDLSRIYPRDWVKNSIKENCRARQPWRQCRPSPLCSSRLEKHRRRPFAGTICPLAYRSRSHLLSGSCPWRALRRAFQCL